MKDAITHIYCVPGLAADVSIFEYIKLPEEKYELHVIPWRIPKKDEDIAVYAKRMSADVIHQNIVLIGVSFGGVMAQEMNAFLTVRKLIIISSVKSNLELPLRIKLAKKTKAYKILPTSLVAKIDDWEKLAFGDFAKKRAAMYQKYLSLNDKGYLDWAIENMVCWKREKSIPNIIHIHGDKDIVFPIANIKNCILLSGGTHVMIINRARWFNKHLPSIIEGSFVKDV